MKRLLLISSLLLGLASAGLAQEEDAVTLPSTFRLEAIVELALTNSPMLKQAEGRVAETHGLVKEYGAAGLPRLDLSGAYQVFDDKSLQSFGMGLLPDDTRWDAKAEASVTIIDGGQKRHKVRWARGQRDAEQAVFAATRAELLAAVHAAYYAAQLAEAQIAAQEEALVVLGEQLKMAQSRLDARTATRFDVSQAEVAVANAKPALIRARNDYRRRIDELRRLVGLPFPAGVKATDIRIEPQQAAGEIELALEAGLAAAAEDRPEIAEFADRVQAGLSDVRFVKRTASPALELFASYGAQSDQFGDGEVLEGWVAGARVKWPFFDGGRRRGSVDQARARLWVLREQERATALAVEGEVRQAFYDYEEARTILETASLAVGLAAESLELARNRYAAGRGTQLDVLESQLQLTRARVERSTAIHDTQRAVISIRRAVGDL